MISCRRIAAAGRVAAAIASTLTIAGGLAGCIRHGPAAPRFDSLATAARCADIDFPIYFDPGSDHLTPAARLVLANEVAQARGCTISSTEVTGLTPPDPTAAELALSKLRAAEVGGALTQAGLPAPTPEVIDTRPARSRVRIARRSARVLIHLHP